MKKLRICFVGKMRSGKSESVNYITEGNFDTGKTITVDFGDALKEVARILRPHDLFKDRSFLQRLGQHMRKIDENIWIEPVHLRLMSEEYDTVICASCRQQNEYDYLKKLGFIFIKINCLDALRVLRAELSFDSFNLADMTHETELEIDNFKCDYEIMNYGDLHNLHKQLNIIMEDILNG